MDAVWYRRYRAEGGDRGPLEWELSTEAPGFGEDAPARVGKLVADTLGVALPDRAVAVTNDVVHWMTGIGWGTVAGPRSRSAAGASRPWRSVSGPG
jgi:hypothetical protein